MQRLFSLAALVALLTFAAPSSGVYAQDADGDGEGRGRIRGTVVTAKQDRPLQGATVAVRNPSDSTLVTGVTTDSTGAFAVRVPLGEYTVQVSFVGYTPTRVTDVRLTRSRADRNLGTVRLQKDTEQLEEVTISAQRPAVEVETDRTIYNTQQQIVTAGGSARTVLNDLPSIRVDLDGSISLRGSEGVVVHINGEPTSLTGQSLANFLESLPASAVERVEVIPNPSAKEEPEGAAGIINIVLKRNRGSGWSGGATAGGGVPETVSASANAGYQTGNWRFFANYGFRSGAEDESATRFLREFDSEGGADSEVDQSSSESESERSHTLNTQIEFRPTESTTLSTETVFNTEAETKDTRTNYVEREGGALRDRFARLIDGTSAEQSLDARASVNHEFGPDHTLAAELRYEREWESEEGTYTERAMDENQALGPLRQQERDDRGEDESEGTLEIDYTAPFPGDVTFEAGYQGERRVQLSDQVFLQRPQPDAPFAVQQTSDFDYRDRTHAAYAQATVPLTDALEAKAGLRAEHTTRSFELAARDEVFDESYANLFPSAFLTYKQNERYQGRLSYSKRIRRPGTWQLDPVDDNEDPRIRFVGNPSLDPEYVHSFELSMTRKWDAATVSLTPFFRRTVNEIERRETVDSGVTTLTFDNFASSNSYGVELVTSLEVEDWVQGNVTLNANRIVTDASNVDTDLSNDAMAYGGRARLTFPLAYGFDLQVSQYYQAPRDIAGGRIQTRSSSDVALRKELFGGKGNLSLRASDVFDSNNFDVYRRTDEFYSESFRDWSQRRIILTFSYAFGKEDAQRGGRDRR